MPRTAEIHNKQCLNERINDNEFIHSTLQLNWVSEWVSGSRSVVSDSLWPHGLYSPWNSPGQNTGVGSLYLFQGIFPTQGSNPGLPHCRQKSLIFRPASSMPLGTVNTFGEWMRHSLLSPSENPLELEDRCEPQLFLSFTVWSWAMTSPLSASFPVKRRW